jgi:hypothetical protein
MACFLFIIHHSAFIVSSSMAARKRCCFEPNTSRLAPGNETMEINETNETLFFRLCNQEVGPPKGGPTSQESKKCGILPHSGGSTIVNRANHPTSRSQFPGHRCSSTGASHASPFASETLPESPVTNARLWTPLKNDSKLFKTWIPCNDRTLSGVTRRENVGEARRCDSPGEGSPLASSARPGT